MKHMAVLQAEFRQQVRAIYKYLRMLQFIDQGSAQLLARGAVNPRPIDLATTHVLKASVYLHLYNLIEATVRSALARVAKEIEAQNLTFVQLTKEWQASWLKTTGRSTEALNAEARLASLLEVATHIVSQNTVAFEPDLPGGNVDDRRIEKLLERHGVALKLHPTLRVRVKKPILNEHGPLGVVRLRRNELAHGLDSFEQCGRGASVTELTTWAVIVTKYLRQVIAHCELYIERRGFKAAADVG